MAKKAGTQNPYNTFTKSLPQEKKRPFMELMKRLREAKKSTDPDKRKQVVGIDSDIHKLLTKDNYKRYRGVAEAVKQTHLAKKASGTSSSAAAPATAAAAAAPAAAAAGAPVAT